METITLSGYTELEKEHIASQHLIPKQTAENGLKNEQISLRQQAVSEVIQRYTREAGVRNLEREISKICRKVATQIVTKQTKQKVIVNQKKVHELLGAPKYKHAKGEDKNEVGVTCGLAWTQVGGELLMTEVSVMKGSGQLQLTGKLGEVMKESAQAAQSFVRTQANSLGIFSQVFKDMDIHIHVPEGAVPKDGPSAGVTITTSLVSALTGIPVRKDVAMTGEISLRGKVLPIGGLKEKLLAAKRAEMKTVLIPHENLKDLEEVPNEITNGLEILPMKHVEEVLKNALCRFPDSVQDPLEEEKVESENNDVINQEDLPTANPSLPS
jgi:ATP-dependent Lon protease